MPKIPYEIVAVTSEKIYNKVLFARTQDEIIQAHREHKEYLEACGWSVEEFDLEMLRRIDQNWVDKKNIDWN
jgi:hypothetical protein